MASEENVTREECADETELNIKSVAPPINELTFKNRKEEIHIKHNETPPKIIEHKSTTCTTLEYCTILYKLHEHFARWVRSVGSYYSRRTWWDWNRIYWVILACHLLCTWHHLWWTTWSMRCSQVLSSTIHRKACVVLLAHHTPPVVTSSYILYNLTSISPPKIPTSITIVLRYSNLIMHRLYMSHNCVLVLSAFY